MSIQHNGKKIIMINVHRLPVASFQGPQCYATQCNVVEGLAKSMNECRKESF